MDTLYRDKPISGCCPPTWTPFLEKTLTDCAESKMRWFTPCGVSRGSKCQNGTFVPSFQLPQVTLAAFSSLSTWSLNRNIRHPPLKLFEQKGPKNNIQNSRRRAFEVVLEFGAKAGNTRNDLGGFCPKVNKAPWMPPQISMCFMSIIIITIIMFIVMFGIYGTMIISVMIYYQNNWFYWYD